MTSQSEDLRRPSHEETGESTHPLVEDAIKDALSRLDPKHRDLAAVTRVTKGITYALAPYIEEGGHIAKERKSPRYLKYLENFREFNPSVGEGVIACPDGRIDINYIFGGPGEVKSDRRIGGVPDVRKSTQENVTVIDDPDLSSSIDTAVGEKKEDGIEEPELIEYAGPHIISTSPDHGCGYLSGETQDEGFPPGLGMTIGGIEEYLAKVNAPLLKYNGMNLNWLSAFGNNAKRAGGRGTSFFTIVDHYSQGLIFTPPNLPDMMDPNLTLRGNLEALQGKGEILMTEALDDAINEQVRDSAARMGHSGELNYRDYHNLIDNTILIGRVAMEVTAGLEKDGFKFIPPSLIKDASPAAVKALAFRAVRNSTFRILSGLIKGSHPLMRHPERFVRAGSTGAEYNSQFVPFIQRTTGGRFTEPDVIKIQKLYGILTTTLLERGTNLQNTGRVIVITGEVNPTDFRTRRIAEGYLRNARAFIAHNASIFRDRYEKSIATGQTIVLGVLFDSSTHTPMEIVGRR